MMTPQNALIEIQLILSAEEWSPDTLDSIAEVMQAAGYTIEDSNACHEEER